MHRQILLQWCEQTLQTSQFQDYAPNGLQVEGTTDVQHIITAVTASRAAIDFAGTSWHVLEKRTRNHYRLETPTYCNFA